MKKLGQIVCLAGAPAIAFAHEGMDPGSVLHSFAHLGESWGLIVAVPVALAVVVLLKRRRAAVRSTPPE